MNTITRLVVYAIISLAFATTQGQTKELDSIRKADVDYKISNLEEEKTKIEEQEKSILKLKISKINKRLDDKEITAEEAENLKKEAAKVAALNIENRTEIVESKIALLKRNGYDSYQYRRDDNERVSISIGSGGFHIDVSSDDKPKRKPKFDRRTFGENVSAIGFNNTLIDGVDLDDSPYKLGGSGFVEWGYTLNTRIFKNTNFWRLKYGFSFQWNKLNIKDNQYFVNNDGDITLQEFPLEINKAKFRTTNLVIPVHLEFGPSKKIEKENYFRYSRHRQLKIGIGGYAGVNLGSMQKLKYKEDGNRVKNKQRGGYEVSNFVYGLSGYIGIGEVALYVKYDLNPLFKNQAIDQNNISIGIRFDTL
ncbi:coiled-coil domain-containing protein [Winogradskyella flava]|uniref:coiled-coil domain-containing protein n=1 Tax=Winogradskyella flava TaxID=1884876 RepID=UPI00248FA33C|nr:hypothetical protein [Winogradskyella flava]